MSHNAPAELLEAYLAAIAARLQGLPEPEVKEILQELRSHVLEQLQGTVGAHSMGTLLERLGDPAAIAREHLEARLDEPLIEPDAVPADRRGWGRATLHLLGILLGSALAYGFAVCWLYTAIRKPIHPAQVGLWLLPDPTGDLNISLGWHRAETAGRDLLGWWILPLGLAIGGWVMSATLRWNLRCFQVWIHARRLSSCSAARL